MIPLVVIEGVAIGGPAVAAARSALERDGWLVLAGWPGPADPPRPGRVVRAGAVDDAGSAAGAVLAALSGAGVLVAARAERALVDRLCEDLRRFGPVDHRLPAARPADREDAEPGLAEPDRRLLALILAGASLGEAAAAVHISRRTADRRIAALRRHYRVTSTAEALLAARRRGDLR